MSGFLSHFYRVWRANLVEQDIEGSSSTSSPIHSSSGREMRSRTNGYFIQSFTESQEPQQHQQCDMSMLAVTSYLHSSKILPDSFHEVILYSVIIVKSKLSNDNFAQRCRDRTDNLNKESWVDWDMEGHSSSCFHSNSVQVRQYGFCNFKVASLAHSVCTWDTVLSTTLAGSK